MTCGLRFVPAAAVTLFWDTVMASCEKSRICLHEKEGTASRSSLKNKLRNNLQSRRHITGIYDLFDLEIRVPNSPGKNSTLMTRQQTDKHTKLPLIVSLINSFSRLILASLSV